MITEPKGKPKQQRSNSVARRPIMDLIMKFAWDEGGTAALEYSLVMTLIGIFLISSISFLGSNLIGVFTSMTTKLGGG
jgi:pilus assembly protein Flp/PilA